MLKHSKADSCHECDLQRNLPVKKAVVVRQIRVISRRFRGLRESEIESRPGISSPVSNFSLPLPRRRTDNRFERSVESRLIGKPRFESYLEQRQTGRR